MLHETTQAYVSEANVLLEKNVSFFTDNDIVLAAYFSQQLGSLTGFARSESDQKSMFEAVGAKKKVLVQGSDGQLSVEVQPERKQLMIGSKESAAFVRRRIYDVWCVFHGEAAASRWFLQLEQMADDVPPKNLVGVCCGRWHKW